MIRTIDTENNAAVFYCVDAIAKGRRKPAMGRTRKMGPAIFLDSGILRPERSEYF